jgi:OTU-like cysteine protease.
MILSAVKVISQAHDRAADLEMKMRAYERTIETLQRELDQLSDDRDYWKEECNNWRNKCKRLERELDTARHTMENLNEFARQNLPITGTDGFSFLTKRILGTGTCMFQCIAWALEPDLRKEINERQENQKRIGHSFKKLVSHWIMKDASLRLRTKELFDLTPLEYIMKVEEEDYQGTEFDLRVFSKHFSTEIFIVKVSPGKLEPHLISESLNYSRRIYLLHDCTNPKHEHYELIIAKNYKSFDMKQFCIFSPKDENAQAQAFVVAKEFKKF